MFLAQTLNRYFFALLGLLLPLLGLSNWANADQYTMDEALKFEIRDWFNNSTSSIQFGNEYVTKKWDVNLKVLYKGPDWATVPLVALMDGVSKLIDQKWTPVTLDDWREFNILVVIGNRDDILPYLDTIQSKQNNNLRFWTPLLNSMTKFDKKICSSYAEWNSEYKLTRSLVLVEFSEEKDDKSIVHDCLVRKTPSLFGLPSDADQTQNYGLSQRLSAIWLFYREFVPVGATLDDLQRIITEHTN